MPTINVKCPTPGCEGTEFTENSMAPVVASVIAWELRNGVPHPDQYGSSTTIFDAEEIDAEPYHCGNCGRSFTAAQLIVVTQED